MNVRDLQALLDKAPHESDIVETTSGEVVKVEFSGGYILLIGKGEA